MSSEPLIALRGVVKVDRSSGGTARRREAFGADTRRIDHLLELD